MVRLRRWAMVAWRVTAGFFAIVTAAFAVWWAQIASNYYLLSAEIRQSIGRSIPEDDPVAMAVGYLAASLVLSAVAGALSCYAAIARPVASRATDVGEPRKPIVATPVA